MKHRLAGNTLIETPPSPYVDADAPETSLTGGDSAVDRSIGIANVSRSGQNRSQPVHAPHVDGWEAPKGRAYWPIHQLACGLVFHCQFSDTNELMDLQR